MKDFDTKINEKIIDSHLHIEGIYNENGIHFLHGFDEYKQTKGIKSLNVAALPSGKRDVANNIMCAFYKLVNPDDFIHGGLVYTEYPAKKPAKEGMTPLEQYNELMEIGFDGIKMLEGKPQLHKLVGLPLCDDYFDEFFSAIEKDGTHLLFHVNDPEEFWDPAFATDDLRSRGWFYGDGDYASNEEVYRQIYAFLEKHPNLCVTFAHFFFYSKNPKKLEELFAKYPNTCVDLTPGWEMYVSFSENPEYYGEFFRKYSQRVLLGTDSTFPYPSDDMKWLCDRVYRYLATDDTVKSFYDLPIKGINLPKEHKENIIFRNFERRVGTEPKKINKEALKRYIEKYKHLIKEKEYLYEIEKLAKELL